MNKLKISVIIPTYNCASCLPVAIQSVLGQTLPLHEILVIDDGSKDNTKDVVKPYLNNIKYIYQENGGASNARNRGIKEATGEWIAFLDADDEWCKENLEQHVNFVNKHPQCGVHASNILMERSHIKRTDYYQLSGMNLELDGGEIVIQRPLLKQIKYSFCWLQNSIIKKSLIVEAGMFNEKLKIYEDFDLFCKMALLTEYGASSDIQVKINRREDVDNLSSLRLKKPELAYQYLVTIYDCLYNRNDLDRHERTCVRKQLASAYSGLSNCYSSSDKYIQKITALKKSLHYHFSIKRLLKLAIVKISLITKMS